MSSADLTQPRPNPYPEEIKAMHAALAKAQAEYPPIERSKTVRVRTKDGGSYEFAYAPLDAILAAVRPVLAAHGIAIIQRLENPAGTPSIRTELLHAEGAAIAASFPIGEIPASPQALGSLLTYLRRYALVSMLGIAAEEDTDGPRPEPLAPPPAARPSVSGSEPDPFTTDAEQGDASAEQLTDAQRRKIYAIRTKLIKAEAITEDGFKAAMGKHYGTESVAELTAHQASDLIGKLEAIEP